MKTKRNIKNIDPKYLGIPNICFSLTEKEDKREKKYSKQRISRGFDDSETWSLEYTITKFILPRLKRYRVIIDGFIANENGFYEDIDKSIRAFELVIKDEKSFMTEEEEVEYKEGIKCFGRIFRGLWW